MDSLDVRGYFGLPDQPEETRVPGQLVFSTADGGSLSLIGEISGLGRQPSRLVGEAEDQSYTLEDCLQTLSAPGQGKQVLLVQRLIVGAIYAKDEPVTADRASMKLANLTHWAGTAGYAGAIRPGEGEQPAGRWTLSSDPIQPLSVSIPAGTLQLEQRRDWIGDGITSRTLTQDAWFHIEFDEVLPLPDVVDVASDLQDLVSIGTNRPAAFEHFRLWHPDFYRELRGGRQIRLPVDYLAEWNARPDAQKRPPDERDMAFTFTELGGMDGVAKWLKVAAKYRSMLGRVMNTRYERRMFVEDRLLDRVAALEGFHREWKRTGKKTVWLVDRLTELVTRAGDPFTELVGDTQAWCKRVKKERDNIAHHKGRPAHQDSGAMYFSAEAAYWLFVLCMLRLMRAPAAVFDHITRCPGLCGQRMD
jgi:ApeA N-terminal domain 1/Apea-like HEPN